MTLDWDAEQELERYIAQQSLAQPHIKFCSGSSGSVAASQWSHFKHMINEKGSHIHQAA